jgi:hypothetical protein
MGQLEKPALPEYLYRYRNITAPITNNRKAVTRLSLELRMILEQKLWCAHYRKLNDPMEGFYDPSERIKKATNYSETAANIFHGKQGIGICCFSDSPDNELMWTHYTDQYQGICIGYHPRLLLSGIPENARLVRLGYGLSPPRIGKDDAPYTTEAAIKVLSHKKACWAYEREWRVLALDNKAELQIAAENCIKIVLLGSRISETHQNEIVRNLKGLPITIKRMKVAKYKHTWQLLQSARAAKT